jgi:DAACS family dicarboxylate/amino acid:cation (Na+ or H+) symporter
MAAPKGRLVLYIVAAAVAGALAGAVLGPRAEFLGELGEMVVRMLKSLATPLVFFAIVDSLSRARLPAGQGLRLLIICAVNTAVAGLLAVTLARLISPGAHVDPRIFAAGAAEPAAHASAKNFLQELVPDNLIEPLARNVVLAVVIVSLLVGTALRRMRADGRGEALSRLISEGFELFSTVLGFVILAVPIAIFGVVAKMVGTSGLEALRPLGWLCVTVAVGLTLHVTLYYSALLFFVARRNPFQFWRASIDALLTALSAASSMATLPVTLRTLEGPLGIAPENARLAACIGTNFNNDGIMLYEVVAALFIAQAAGIQLAPGDVVALCATSAMAAAGIAGVPEAGLITLSLVLTSAKLPTSAVPVLLTVDWMLGRLRATTNVASDLTVAAILDRFSRRD